MHLLYLDDAGSPANKAESCFVLGGISVSEAQADWFTRELDKLAASIDPVNPSDLEFHASEIFARRRHPWKNMAREEAQGVIKAVLQVVAGSYDSARLFACAVAYAVFRRYNAGDARYFDIIAPRFDSSEGVVHGLVHKVAGMPNCMCPACLSRRLGRSTLGQATLNWEDPQ